MKPESPRDSALDCSALEERILYSASPLASLIGESIDASCDDCDFEMLEFPLDVDVAEVEPTHQLKSEIVFVDAAVDDYDAIVDDIRSSAANDIEIVFIESDVDGVALITESLGWAYRRRIGACCVARY